MWPGPSPAALTVLPSIQNKLSGGAQPSTEMVTDGLPGAAEPPATERPSRCQRGRRQPAVINARKMVLQNHFSSSNLATGSNADPGRAFS